MNVEVVFNLEQKQICRQNCYIYKIDELAKFRDNFIFSIFFYIQIQIQIDEINEADDAVSWDWLRLERCSW